MAAEKRAEPRIRAHWPVKFVWESGYAHGLTENLSRSGAQISIEDEPPVYAGEEVVVTVTLPGEGDTFEVVARIRWVDEDLPNTIGLAFDEPLPDDARTLLEILQKVESR